MKYLEFIFVIPLLFVIVTVSHSQALNEEEPLAHYSETPELEEKEIEYVDEAKGSFNSKRVERYLTKVNPGYVGLSAETSEQLEADKERLKSSPGAENLPYSFLSVGDYNNQGNGGKGFLKAVGFLGAVALEYADDRHCTVD